MITEKTNERLFALQLAIEDLGKATGQPCYLLRALIYLAGHPNAKTSALAPELNLTTGAIAGIVGSMVASGLIKRQSVAGDRRVIGLSLTKSGAHVLEQAASRLDSLFTSGLSA